MKNKKIAFFVFAAIVMMVPLYVAYTSHDILSNGKLYKFKLQAYDPFDPFRGKFLRLNYNTRRIATEDDFEEGDDAYVKIGLDEEGFAFFESVSKEPPKEGDYMTTTIKKVRGKPSVKSGMRSIFNEEISDLDVGNYKLKVDITIPDHMQKYFLNEEYAKKGERVLRSQRDFIYIGMRVKNGSARMEDLYVKDIPLMNYLREE
jgi:uncharacterized membrane-anchored protein